jgi:hypothetical protein
MTELSPGAAKRMSDRLQGTRHEYIDALMALVPVVEQAASNGDLHARRLLEDVERARVRMVCENMAAADVLH